MTLKDRKARRNKLIPFYPRMRERRKKKKEERSKKKKEHTINRKEKKKMQKQRGKLRKRQGRESSFLYADLSFFKTSWENNNRHSPPYSLASGGVNPMLCAIFPLFLQC